MYSAISRGPVCPFRKPLLGLALGLVVAGACCEARALAAWEGSASWVAAWEADQEAVHLLDLTAAGPTSLEGWRLETEGVLRISGGPAGEPLFSALREGRLVLAGPPARLQFLLDRPHLTTGDPLALIQGSRRGDRQPALTLEAAGRAWDLTAQLVRQIDNPGPDGDLASMRVQRWWPEARAALTLFQLKQGMLPPFEDGSERMLLQQLAALEGYLRAGQVEMGLEAARASTADLKAPEAGSLTHLGAGLIRLRTLPWRPSTPFRLEAGLFQTDPAFRSLAARERAFPSGSAGGWVEAHWAASGGRRLDAAFLHGRQPDGKVAAEAALQGRLTRAGLTWEAGLEAKKGVEDDEPSPRGRFGLRRAAGWEAEVSVGPDTARVKVEVSLIGDTQARLGWDGAHGGIVRVELRRAGDRGSWRLVWKRRGQGEPDQHLFVEGERSLSGGWFAGVKVGRWDRGRADVLWGWPQHLELNLGRRF